MKLKTLIPAVMALLLAGCNSIKLQMGDAKFSRSSLGTDIAVKSIKVTDPATGHIVEVSGLTSKQAATMEAVARGAAEGARASQMP